MLQEMRNSLNLSRQQVADAIGRSPGFILKAEQFTFPSPPPALLHFYSDRLGTQFDQQLLTAAYHREQRKRRLQWLNQWQPRLVAEQAGTGTDEAVNFRRAWVPQATYSLSDSPHWAKSEISEPEHPEHPTQYALSQGLCLPAAVVYRLELNNELSRRSVVLVAMEQLVDYVESGAYYAEHGLSAQTQAVTANLIDLHELLLSRVKAGRWASTAATGPVGKD